MNEISVTSGGPIEGIFKIDLSPGPGVYEFRGARGTGKTTCISCIDLLAGHKIDITLHDGALSGKVEGFGVVAPIGGRKRRKGELSLDTIDAEKFSLGDLIDPPGKTPEVRDAHAIKALAVLSGVEADPKLYYELARGQAEFDGLGIQKSDDPVLLATRVKQAFDKIARACQNTAEAEAGHAAPLEVVPEGLDISQSSDLEELSAERDGARDKYQTLLADREYGLEHEAQAEQAKERLEKVEAEYTGMTVTDAEVAARTAQEAADAAKQKAGQLREELDAADKVWMSRGGESQIASARLTAAQQHAEAVSALEDTASHEVTYPTPEEIETAEVTVAYASQAYDQGLRIRDVKQNQGHAKGHRKAESTANWSAAEAKNQAGQVFDILAKSLHTSHLSIHTVDGYPRLFVQHPMRGRTAFDRVNGLSDGERVDFTLRELLPHIASPGLLPIPQQIWQDLQPADRERLHEFAVDKGLYIFGAQVDDGELRVVYFGTGE